MNGIFCETKLRNLRQKEVAKTELLDWEEAKRRQKRRETWIAQGNENTRFFHNYANMRKTINTIWSIKDSRGEQIHRFKDLTKVGSIVSRICSRNLMPIEQK